MCRALAAEGAKVGLTFNRGEAVADELVAEGACARRLDLTVTRDIPRVIDELSAELGGVTSFVHCAGVGSASAAGAYDRIADPDEAGWDRLMAINVRSAFFACQHLACAFGPGGGNVVLVGSIDGEKSVPSPTPYATSKGALSAMARSLAKALGAQRIRVNVVAPGLLESGAARSVPEEVRADYVKHSGSKRLGRHDEIARIVAWLALENTYVTGQTLFADGGL